MCSITVWRDILNWDERKEKKIVFSNRSKFSRARSPVRALPHNFLLGVHGAAICNLTELIHLLFPPGIFSTTIRFGSAAGVYRVMNFVPGARWLIIAKFVSIFWKILWFVENLFESLENFQLLVGFKILIGGTFIFHLQFTLVEKKNSHLLLISIHFFLGYTWKSLWGFNLQEWNRPAIEPSTWGSRAHRLADWAVEYHTFTCFSVLTSPVWRWL